MKDAWRELAVFYKGSAQIVYPDASHCKASRQHCAHCLDRIPLLILLILSLALTACGRQMSEYHPIVGQWALVRGTPNAFRTLEFEPSGTVLVDNEVRSMWHFTGENKIRFDLPTSSLATERFPLVMGITLSDNTLTLTGRNGQPDLYRRISFCSSEMRMASPCPYDRKGWLDSLPFR